MRKEVWRNMRGISTTITYKRWEGMRHRCRRDKRYIKNGITVCPEWHDFYKFKEDMGECPSGLSLDRINGKLGYFKENCRWADSSTQNNTKFNHKRYDFNGQMLTLTQWAEAQHISLSMARTRLRKLGMRAGGGKAKGAQWEREVCVILSRWLSSNTKDDIFWRSAISGGRATVAFKKGKQLSNQVGDISCIDPMGQKFANAFAVEIKFYKSFDWSGLLTGKGNLVQFWEKINKETKIANKSPILIIRQNRMPTFACFDRGGILKLGLKPKEMVLVSYLQNIYIIGLTKFTSTCTPFN